MAIEVKKEVNRFVIPGKVKDIVGNVFTPANARLSMVVNFGQKDGSFNSEFDKRLAKQWPRAKSDFKGWHAMQQNFKMGEMTTTAVGSDVWVVSLLVKSENGSVDVIALNKAIKNLAKSAKYENASVHVHQLVLDEVPGLRDILVEEIVSNGTNLYFYTDAEQMVKR